jgi:predicted nucleic acid-binding protein
MKSGDTALADLAALEIERHAHGGLVDRACALRGNRSFYDALHGALAEMLDAPLVAFDARIAGSPGAAARVEVLSVDG